MPCTDAPADAHYIGSGGLWNKCEWQCNEGFFKELASGRCFPCASCPVGSFRSGCHGRQQGMCKNCTQKVRHSKFVGEGGIHDACPWACSSGFYENGTGSASSCLQCALDCPAGEFRHGCGTGVNGSSPGKCVPCGSPPPGSHYTGSGGLQGTCPWICDSGFYWDVSGSCKECTASRCTVGQYLDGCGRSQKGSCEMCTNQDWFSHFVSAGMTSDGCSVECTFGWPLTPLKSIPLPPTPSPCMAVVACVVLSTLLIITACACLVICMKHRRKSMNTPKTGASPAAVMAGVEYKARQRNISRKGVSEECAPMIPARPVSEDDVHYC